MDKPIISSKGTTHSIRKIMLIICAVLLILTILFLFIIHGEINSYPSLYRAIIMKKYVPLILLIVAGCSFGFIGLVLIIHLCSSYVDVYADHLEGKLIQDGIRIVNIELSLDKVISVSYARTSLYINSSNGKYAVMTNPSTAKAICDFCNRSGI